MTESVLNKIVESRKESIARDKGAIDLKSLEKIVDLDMPRSLTKTIQEPGISLIAEVKMASPSRGVIRDDIPAVEIMLQYEAAGASALSILTEPDHFNGNWLYLRTARDFCGLPILCKDFIIDEFQLHMARANGADAVLLIAAILDDLQLNKLIKAAHKLEMEVLTEAINREELDRVLASKTDMIGINNRDLHTLEIDMERGLELLENIPHDRPVVMESGISTHEDVLKLEKLGADGILVGTSLMESDDITAKVQGLLGKAP